MDPVPLPILAVITKALAGSFLPPTAPHQKQTITTTTIMVIPRPLRSTIGTTERRPIQAPRKRPARSILIRSLPRHPSTTSHPYLKRHLCQRWRKKRKKRISRSLTPRTHWKRKKSRNQVGPMAVDRLIFQANSQGLRCGKLSKL